MTVGAIGGSYVGQSVRTLGGDALAGNLCRCTGYQSIVRAVKAVARALAAAGQAPA